MTIRRGESADHAAIAAVWLERAHHIDGGAPSQASISRLKERIATGMARGWYVEVATATGNDIVGFIAIVRKDHVLDQ